MKNKNLKYILYFLAIVVYAIFPKYSVKAAPELCGRYHSVSGSSAIISVYYDSSTGQYSGKIHTRGTPSGADIANFGPSMSIMAGNCPIRICAADGYSKDNFVSGNDWCWEADADSPLYGGDGHGTVGSGYSGFIDYGYNSSYEDEAINVIYIIGMILLVIRIVVPILLIVVASIDLIKAMTAKDESSMTPIFRATILKVISAIIIFLIPTLVAMLMKLVNQSTLWNQYATCLSHPSTCNTHLWEGIQ